MKKIPWKTVSASIVFDTTTLPLTNTVVRHCRGCGRFISTVVLLIDAWWIFEPNTYNPTRCKKCQQHSLSVIGLSMARAQHDILERVFS